MQIQITLKNNGRLLELQLEDKHTTKLVFDTENNWNITYFEYDKWNISEENPKHKQIAKLTRKKGEKLS